MLRHRSAVELAKSLADDVFAGTLLFRQSGDDVRDGLLDLRALESELFECEESILHFARLRDILRETCERKFGKEFHDLVAELDDHAFGGLGPDAADMLEDLDVRVDDGVAERGDVHAAENGEGGLRSDSVYGEQELEDLEFFLFCESEELKRVLADLEPSQDCGGTSFLRKHVVGAHGDGDEVSDAVHVEDEFCEIQGNDLACELSDHIRASFPARACAGFVFF